MSSGNKRNMNQTINSLSNSKITSLVEDFNTFSKMFSLPKRREVKKKRRKPKVAAVPNILRQSSNISEDSNDPKRRKNVLGSILNLNNSLNIAKQLPNINQSINEEEDFKSEDLSDKSESVKKEEIKKEKPEEIISTRNANMFFVHRKVKNNRQSILADRPLTIFKAATQKEPSRFFSPPPTSNKLIEMKPNENQSNIKSNTSIKRKLNPMSISKFAKSKKKETFKKVMISFHNHGSKNMKFFTPKPKEVI